MRALLGTASNLCEVVVLKLRTVPLGTALNLRIIRVVRRGAQAMYKRGGAVIPLGGDVGGAQAKLPASNNKTTRSTAFVFGNKADGLLLLLYYSQA